MKSLLIFGTLILWFIYIDGHQHLYTFIPDRCVIKYVNHSMVRYNNKSRCFKLSRMELYLNVSFSLNVDILNDSMGQIKITGYQLRSNEYRKGPIEFMLGICTAIRSKLYDIPHILANSNLRCPLLKGRNYYAYNVSPNATNMPPFIPEGKWMLELTFMYMNKYVLGILEWYATVEYPLKM